MKRLISFLLFPVYVLIGVLVVLFRMNPEPPMFVGPDKPNPEWLTWYCYRHRTSSMNAKAAFISLSKRMYEPSYFDEPEKWLERFNNHPSLTVLDEARKAFVIRTAARTLDLRKLNVTILGLEEPKDLLSENKEAFNVEWIDYHSAIKGITVECVLFNEIQKQVREHNRFIDQVYINA